MKLPKEFYQQKWREAPDLLGLTLVHNTKEGILKGKIVEVEAYMGTKDLCCHSYSGKPTKEPRLCLALLSLHTFI